MWFPVCEAIVYYPFYTKDAKAGINYVHLN
jgi:hypothetical protein